MDTRCSLENLLEEMESESQRNMWFGLVWFVGFYGISIFEGYLTPNPFYVNNLFYLKQFSLA